MRVSIVIRTYNEQKYLDRLLSAIFSQDKGGLDVEVVVIDSGSTDNTVNIAAAHNCRITHIKKNEFTFGRSLNQGCAFARGEVLVFISGHCIPAGKRWLKSLIRPLLSGQASYSYGRQVGYGTTRFSEIQHFKKWFPETSKTPQKGYFCNNANAAIVRKIWSRYCFDETLTGLEDLDLAKRLVDDGESVAYSADAMVYHIHEESWLQIRHRYEREAIALHKILPELIFTRRDLFRYFFTSIFSDFSVAYREKTLPGKIGEIIMFRWMQYWGTYRGNREHRVLSEKQKRKYFYPGESGDIDG